MERSHLEDQGVGGNLKEWIQNIMEAVDRGMDALSDLGLSEVAPQEGRPQVLWNVCRSGSKAHLPKQWLADVRLVAIDRI